MEKKKVPQNVLDTNVSNETVENYAEKHKKVHINLDYV